MMLHLYIAALRKQPMFVDNIVSLTSKNTATGSRWIKHLSAENMIDVDGDVISPSGDAFDRMNEYHSQAMNLLEA